MKFHLRSMRREVVKSFLVGALQAFYWLKKGGGCYEGTEKYEDAKHNGLAKGRRWQTVGFLRGFI